MSRPAVQKQAPSKPEAGFWDFLRTEDVAQESDATAALTQSLDQTAAALRVAVDQLTSAYCEEIRRSPWYIASQRRRIAAIDVARAPQIQERRLLAYARSLGRQLRALYDEVMDPTRVLTSIAIGLDGEISIFEQWRELRFNLSRLHDRSEELGLGALALPKSHYIPAEGNRRSFLEAAALATDLGSGLDLMLVWLQSNLLMLNDVLNAWIAASEAAIENPELDDAERDARRLEDDVIAAARQRLPANLRPWMQLPD